MYSLLYSNILLTTQTTNAVLNDRAKMVHRSTYIGKEATVILNPETGEVVTTWKTGSRIRKKYEKE